MRFGFAQNAKGGLSYWGYPIGPLYLSPHKDQNEEKDDMRRVQLDIDENDETSGVKTISIVSDPAIESNFIVMARQQGTNLHRLSKLILRGFETNDFALIDRLTGRMRITQAQLYSIAMRIHRYARLRQQGFQMQEKR